MTLVDVSTVDLDQAVAAARALATTISTVHADVSTWRPRHADFDLVIVANLHSGPDALAAMLAGAARALRPGGHLYVVVGHHVSSLGRHGPPDPTRLLTADRLRAALPAPLVLEVLDTRRRGADHGQAREQSPDDTDTVMLAWARRPPTPTGRHR